MKESNEDSMPTPYNERNNLHYENNNLDNQETNKKILKIKDIAEVKEDEEEDYSDELDNLLKDKKQDCKINSETYQINLRILET